MKPTRYRDSNRLADVMALIQVLAQAEGALRSEDGLKKQLVGDPTSDAPSWTYLAENHREFFRVLPASDDYPKATLSLISRHVLPKDAEGNRPRLSPEFTAKLLDIAISLYDREQIRRQRFIAFLTIFIPIGGAIVAGL